MALFTTATFDKAAKDLPDSVRDKALAIGKWVYSNHDDASLTPVDGFEGRQACIIPTADGLYRLTIDIRNFPPNLYLVGLEKVA